MALMDIFKRKGKKQSFEEKQKEKSQEQKNGQSSDKKNNLPSESGIIKPHVTEKSSLLGGKSVYVFKVKSNLNKIMVKAAVKNAYGVNPLKIRIINAPSKSVFLKRRRAARPGFKKAVVYLKKGEKIDIT